MMKFLWGRKKQDAAKAEPAKADATAAGGPEIPSPPSSPTSPPTPQETPPPTAPPETPTGPVTPKEPPPTPDPVHAPPPDQPEIPPPSNVGGGFLSRLTDGLRRSSSKLSEQITGAFTKRKLDAAALQALEDVLITADLGAGPARRVIEKLKSDRFDKEASDADVRRALAEVVAETLSPHERDFDLSGPSPQVVLFVGVNGSGKTTTLGKIAAMVTRSGHKAVLAAGDTFRAAAIEQVSVWGQRAGAPVIAREIGADAAGLVFDAYSEAKSRGAEVLLVDTAGRLQNKQGLMQELAKIVRVLKKQDESAPHHVLLVLDATVGQNAISQAEAFREIAGVTGLVMTKLDGTAKGGVLVALADKHPDLPIYFTGVGEGVDDLRPFSAKDFAKALAGA